MPKQLNIGITSSDEHSKEAVQLANKFNWIFFPDSRKVTNCDYLLTLTGSSLALLKTNEPAKKPYHIDFLSKQMLYRVKDASLKNELIGRAIGYKPAQQPAIIDATAGLGRDSFILAALGFRVTMIERSPIIYALLQDALERAKKHRLTNAIVSRLCLIHADATEWLYQLSPENYPQVIYLDPMFPSRQKSASVKKEMIILQELLTKDIHHEKLFNAAMTRTQKRIIVKRPRLSEPIMNKTPSFSLRGNSSRFDIYIQLAVSINHRDQ